MIDVEIGRMNIVLEALREFPEVKTADIVTHPYDIIAMIETEDNEAMIDFARDKVHALMGVSCVERAQIED